MIKINDQQYDDYEVRIIWQNILHVNYGNKIKGNAPFIEFNIQNKIFVGIETRILKDMLENMSFNEKIDIKKYLSDVTFEDELGWISLITNEGKSNLTRVIDNEFRLELIVNSEEANIIVDTNIKLL